MKRETRETRISGGIIFIIFGNTKIHLAFVPRKRNMPRMTTMMKMKMTMTMTTLIADLILA